MEGSAVQAHWQRIWARPDPERVTWFQAAPGVSIDLVERSGIDPADALIDVGGGGSLLVDALLERYFTDVTVLDVSARGLGVSRKRLAERAAEVSWLCEDVTTWLPDRPYRFWHDRAVFHFLTDPVDRALYAAVMHDALEPGGWAAIGTFAPDGPDRCSGLGVCRHDAESLGVEFGPAFHLVHQARETHVSPTGMKQLFAWSLFRKR